ncbi:MAG: ParA family protein, partial [Cytophagales bacterium]|nr:ParA family protein [Cytophagales bacterium]
IEKEGLHILPSNSTLANVEVSMSGSNDRFGHIQALLESCKSYDFVLIDCPPSISLLSTNALVASDYVLIPMQMEVLAVKGLELLLETIERIKTSLNPSIEILGVLPIMTDMRRNLCREISAFIEAHYSIPIFQQNIRANVKTAEAPSFGQSVVEYAPTSSAAMDYRAFANEFLQHVHSLHLNN